MINKITFKTFLIYIDTEKWIKIKLKKKVRYVHQSEAQGVRSAEINQTSILIRGFANNKLFYKFVFYRMTDRSTDQLSYIRDAHCKENLP